MCGILGYIGAVEDQRFVDALNLQRHRGPDDWGVWREGKLNLGHRRLSIVDLSDSASQPMVVAGGNIVGVFNGEIYNYRELRRELEQAGYSFRTKGDTEVLLNGYHWLGEEIFSRLVGMFAVAIYDKRDGSVLLARDRLGIKPLYVTEIGRDFCFSSEVKSILALSDRPREIDHSAVVSYLSFRYPVRGGTFFKGIDQLDPGSFMKIERGGRRTTKRYWALSDFVAGREEDKGEEYYISALRDLVRSSVEYRMIADVPVGAYLSGGVDSSVVVSEMAQLTNSPVKTFSIGFSESDYNEFSYARLVADRYQTDHKEITLSASQYFDRLNELIRFKDAPLAVPNEVPLYLMSLELKRDITVVLSGEGADEIFGGYGRIFRSADDYSKWQSWNADPTTTSPELAGKLRRKYGAASFSGEVDHFLHLYRYTNEELRRSLLGDAVDLETEDRLLAEHFQSVFDEVPDAPYATKMMHTFERLHLPGLLQRLDTTTMAASVEGRVPFVDHRLVEFAASVPLHHKLRWKQDNGRELTRDLLGDEVSEAHDIPKYILKKSFEGALPDEVLYRRKMGFPVPLDRWFGSDFHAMATAKLANGRLVSDGIVSSDGVASLLASPDLARNHSVAMKVWMLLNLEVFVDAYF
jgi:asparagine synthase (glutamine-hydrolysing)